MDRSNLKINIVYCIIYRLFFISRVIFYLFYFYLKDPASIFFRTPGRSIRNFCPTIGHNTIFPPDRCTATAIFVYNNIKFFQPSKHFKSDLKKLLLYEY